jgi:hypothetical protein
VTVNRHLCEAAVPDVRFRWLCRYIDLLCSYMCQLVVQLYGVSCAAIWRNLVVQLYVASWMRNYMLSDGCAVKCCQLDMQLILPVGCATICYQLEVQLYCVIWLYSYTVLVGCAVLWCQFAGQLFMSVLCAAILCHLVVQLYCVSWLCSFMVSVC